MNKKTLEKIRNLISTYDSVVRVMDGDANRDKTRAYGGILRSVKGQLQEYITEEIIKIAWENIGGSAEQLSIDSRKHKIPIKKEYIKRIKEENIREHIYSNCSKYYYGISVDKQVCVDKKFVMGIECKAYTENAMIKRILVDFSLLKTKFPNISCYLFQLESQLGGDYSEIKEITFGSSGTHTLMSYFPNVELHIFTFLQGERKVDRPIHKAEFFKPLRKERVVEAVMLISENLRSHL